METMNHDIVGLYRRINRFLIEAMKSNSANTSRTNQFDIERLKSYLSAIRFYVDHVVAAPQLDLPETSPTVYTLDDPPQMARIENESMADACRFLEIARDELVHSQSSRISAGLITFDVSRLLSVISKCENFVINYIEVATPLDLPESSPGQPRTEQGKKGI